MTVEETTSFIMKSSNLKICYDYANAVKPLVEKYLLELPIGKKITYMVRTE